MSLLRPRVACSAPPWLRAPALPLAASCMRAKRVGLRSVVTVAAGKNGGPRFEDKAWDKRILDLPELTRQEKEDLIILIDALPEAAQELAVPTTMSQAVVSLKKRLLAAKGKTVSLILPTGSKVEVTVADKSGFQTTLKKYDASALCEEGTDAMVTTFAALKPEGIYRVLRYEDVLSYEPSITIYLCKPKGAGSYQYVQVPKEINNQKDVKDLLKAGQLMEAKVDDFGNITWMNEKFVKTRKDLEDGKSYGWPPTKQDDTAIKTLTGFQDSLVAGQEWRCGDALYREVQRVLVNQQIVRFTYTGQLYDADDPDTSIGQIDAAVVGPYDVVVCSCKTRLLFKYVEDLKKFLTKLEEKRDTIPELEVFRGKKLHGVLCVEALPSNPDDRDQVLNRIQELEFGLLRESGASYSTQLPPPAMPLRSLQNRA